MADGSGEARVVVRVVVMDGGRMVVVGREHCGLLMMPNRVSTNADTQSLALVERLVYIA